MSQQVVTEEQLRQYIQRIERLDNEKSELMQDIKEVFAEAKANGFDIKAMKQVLKIKKIEKNRLAEEEAMFELYREILGI